jgi:drug/metabolite transporter (DMT)-like permease
MSDVDKLEGTGGIAEKCRTHIATGWVYVSTLSTSHVIITRSSTLGLRDGCPKMPDHHQPVESSLIDLLVGVALSFLGACFSSLGNVLIKWTHDRNAALPASEQKPAHRRPMWYFIILLFVLNGISDFAAFAFATISTLAPISSLTIAMNAASAYWLLGERLSLVGVFGTIIIIGGSILAVLSGSRHTSDNDAEEIIDLFRRKPYVIFTIVKVCVMILCGGVLFYYKRLDAAAATAAVAASAVRKKLKNDAADAADAAVVVGDGGRGDASFLYDRRDSDDGGGNGRYDSKVGDGDGDGSGGVALIEKLIDVSDDADTAGEPDVLPSSSSSSSPSSSSPSSPSASESSKSFGKAVAFGMLTAGVGAFTNQLGKAAVELIGATSKGDNQFHKPITYIMFASTIVSAILQLTLMAKMMSSFEAVVIVPIFQSLFIINLILQGEMYFEEFASGYVYTTKFYLFLAACAVVMGGITVLNLAHRPANRETKMRRSSTIIEDIGGGGGGVTIHGGSVSSVGDSGKSIEGYRAPKIETVASYVRV